MEFFDNSFPLNAYIANASGSVTPSALAPGIPAVPQLEHHHVSAHSLPRQVQAMQPIDGTVFNRVAILAEIDELAKFLPPIRLFSEENPTSAPAPIMSGAQQRRPKQRTQKTSAMQPTGAAYTWTQSTDRLAILEEIDQLASSLPPIRILSVDNSPAQSAPGPSQFNRDSDRQYKNPSKPKMQKPRKPHGKHRSEEERIQLLQNDDFVESFGETWVICSGCRKKIQLEKRNQVRYYPRAFLVHRQLCKKRMIAERDREEEERMRSDDDY